MAQTTLSSDFWNYQELRARINKAKLYPTLTKKLKAIAESIFSFETSLDPNDIPRKVAPWG